MVRISPVISNVGKLFAKKGNLEIFERTVTVPRGKDYRILTSFKDGKPFKQVISGKELSVTEKFHTLSANPSSSVYKEDCLRSVPNKARQMWNEAFKDMNWFSEYGDSRVMTQGHKTIVKNFETGESTAVINSWSLNHSIYGKDGANGLIKMLSSQTKKGGKVTKEYSRISVNADEGVRRDISTRTYTRSQKNPNGTVTIESDLRGSKYDPTGNGGYGAITDLWTGGAKKGKLPNETINIDDKAGKVSATLSADDYDVTKHYLSYHV